MIYKFADVPKKKLSPTTNTNVHTCCKVFRIASLLPLYQDFSSVLPLFLLGRNFPSYRDACGCESENDTLSWTRIKTHLSAAIFCLLGGGTRYRLLQAVQISWSHASHRFFFLLWRGGTLHVISILTLQDRFKSYFATYNG